ncbi:MAG: hypothetical protein JO292_08625, partial [Betaproteobacteria bacterium]|nr:hypothetical protein [Betaproteobacteria bacterium]
EHRGDDPEIDELLRDHVPRVDPAHGDSVEHEAAGKKARGDTPFMLGVIEAQALERAQ